MYGSKKQNDVLSNFEQPKALNNYQIPSLKFQNSNKPPIEIMQPALNLNFEEKSFSVPKNKQNDNIYDLFYRERKNFPEDQKIQNEPFVLNRPVSTKEIYGETKENDKSRKINRINENNKNLERMGQQVLNQMNFIENPKNNENGNLKENRGNFNKFTEEFKNKNTYDNFNQRLDHLDKMKKKYEIQRNFDEKQLITRTADPIYVYKDDLDRYKKALERRVLASKNIVIYCLIFL